MTSKKTLALPTLAIVAAFGVTGIANAQAMSFSGIDANADGTLDMTELQATFGANAELALQTYDMNGDGMVEVDEAREVAMRGSVTTNSAMEQTADAAGDTLDQTLQDAEDVLDEEAASMAEDGMGLELGAEATGETSSN
ncbi:hypothetical protein [Maritimibacter sp. DP1N21-5]|uniref:hypothetical protein n=1 Tax=Maritimibacter sp. DP1N21-5 TaxID=2836867 RepID=UPI001C47F8C2|nr:hypothetical protein [Maritimibacter sp. DP1N21-5]MBV7408359.1 hypothetical protein [Maritimibacter sp. DP1N21-5]